MLSKLIRIITWKNKGKLLMISLLLALTIAMFSAMSISNEFLNKNISEVKNKYNAFDFIIKKEDDFKDDKLKFAENKYKFNSQIKEQKIIEQNVDLVNFKPVILFANKQVQVEYKVQKFNENDKISKPFIIEGSKPQNNNEILVTKDLIDSLKVNINSKIKISDKEYTIVGIFGNPENQTKNTTFLTEKSVKKFPVLVNDQAFNSLSGKKEQIIYSKFNDSNLSKDQRNDIYNKIMSDKDLQRKETHDLFKRKSEKITYDENQLCVGKEAVESFSRSKELSFEDFTKVKQILDDSKQNKCNVGIADSIGNEESTTTKQVNIGGNGQVVNATPIDFAISSDLNNKITNFITNFGNNFTDSQYYSSSDLSALKSQMTSLMNAEEKQGLNFAIKDILKYKYFGSDHSKNSKAPGTCAANADGTAFVSGDRYGKSCTTLNADWTPEKIKNALEYVAGTNANLDYGNTAETDYISILPTINQKDPSLDGWVWTPIVNEYKAIYKQFAQEKIDNKNQNTKNAADAKNQTEANKTKIVDKEVKTNKQVTKKGTTVDVKNVTKTFSYKVKTGVKTTYYSLLSSLIDFENLKSSKIVKEQKEKQDVLNMVVFVLLISALCAIITTLITKIINNNKVEIGVLKAIGMKEEKITNAFLFIPAIILLIGFSVSAPLTFVISNLFTKFYNQEFYLPLAKFFSFNVVSLILAVVIPVVALLGYTFISVKYQVGINTLRLLANLGKKEKNKQINNPKLSMLMKQRINTLLQSNDKIVIVSIVSIIVTIFCAIFTLMLFSAWQNYDGIGSEIKTGSIVAYKNNMSDTSHTAESINLHAFQISDVYDSKFNHLDYIGKTHKISSSNPADLTVLGLNQQKSKYYDVSNIKLDDLTEGIVLPEKFHTLYGIEKGYSLKVKNDLGKEYTLEVSAFQNKDNNLFAFTDNTYISAKTKTFGKINAHFNPNSSNDSVASNESFVYLPSSAIEQSKKELFTILGIIFVGIIVAIAIVIPLIAILVGNIYDDNKKIIATMKALGMSSKLIRQTIINPFLIVFSIVALLTILIVSTFVAPLFTDIFFNFIGRDIVYHNSWIGILIVLLFVICVYQLIVLIATIQSNKFKPAKILNDA